MSNGYQLEHEYTNVKSSTTRDRYPNYQNTNVNFQISKIPMTSLISLPFLCNGVHIDIILHPRPRVSLMLQDLSRPLIVFLLHSYLFIFPNSGSHSFSSPHFQHHSHLWNFLMDLDSLCFSWVPTRISTFFLLLIPNTQPYSLCINSILF